MADAPDRLLEIALQTLAEAPEVRQAGRKMLAGMVQANHPGAAAMVARWEAVDGRQRRPQWRRALALAVGLLSAWVLVGAAAGARRYQPVLWHLGYHGNWGRGTAAESREGMAAGLNDRERFLLFGDLSQQPRSEQLRARCLSEPANPADYAAFAFAWRSENQGAFPTDFLAMAQRLDPDNSWFTYHAAGSLAHDAVQRQRPARAAGKSAEAPAWKIADEAKLEQALALLRQAVSQKVFVDRRREFIAERVPLLRQTDWISREAAAGFLLEYFGLDYDLRALSDAVAAKAWLLGETGDAAEFKPLLEDADAFVKTFAAQDNPTLVDAVVLMAGVERLIGNLPAAAAKLGLAAEAAQLGTCQERLRRWSEQRVRRLDSPESETAKQHCSVESEGICNIRSLVKNPPPLADADLRPGRMAEHMLAARAGTLAAFSLLGLGLLAIALYRFCLPQVVLRLARRVNEQLLPSDWAWVLGAGVLLPFGYVTALMRATPLGGQDWGLLGGGAAVLLGVDFLVLALLLLATPALVARWRLGRRAAALGLCRGGTAAGWLAVAVAAAAAVVPVLGMTALPATHLTLALGLKLALLAPLALAIIGSVVRALAVTFTRQFSRATLALTLIPAYASGMLLLMASMPLYQAAQSAWEQGGPRLTSNGATRYEGEVARQLLWEVRETLGLAAGG